MNTRLDAWSAAARLASEHPLGVGPGNFKLYYLKETGRPPGTDTLVVVHNAYLDLAAELGIGAMLVFLLYLGGSFWRASVARARGNGPPGLATAVRTALTSGRSCGTPILTTRRWRRPTGSTPKDPSPTRKSSHQRSSARSRR